MYNSRIPSTQLLPYQAPPQTQLPLASILIPCILEPCILEPCILEPCILVLVSYSTLYLSTLYLSTLYLSTLYLSALSVSQYPVHNIFCWYPKCFPKNLSYKTRDCLFQKFNKKANIEWFCTFYLFLCKRNLITICLIKEGNKDNYILVIFILDTIRQLMIKPIRQ